MVLAGALVPVGVITYDYVRPGNGAVHVSVILLNVAVAARFVGGSRGTVVRATVVAVRPPVL